VFSYLVKTFRIYDELYGYIKLTLAEKMIVDTAAFQRLRRVKQLSLASLVYPGAEHTRFSHSIGVAHVASTIARRLRSIGYISDDEELILRFAALLHDIGHPPLSHALEYAYHVRYGSRARKLHEEVTVAMIRENPEIREALSMAGVDADEVASVVEGTHRNRLLTSLLSSDLDADRLDYLPRDALHTGVAYGLIDRERLVDTLTVDSSGRLALLQKGVEALENFYIARLHMYRAVYHHKTVTAYTLLLSRLFEVLAEEDPEVSEIFTLHGLLRIAKTEDYAFLDDAWLIGKIASLARHGKGSAARLARLFVFRQGPKMVYERVTISSINEAKAELEDVQRRLLTCIPEENLYPYVETVKIRDSVNPIYIISDKGELPASNEEVSPLIARLPAELTILRIYVDRSHARRASDCLRDREKRINTPI
jgi:HD superfamily phosphohydrolase